MLHLHAPCLGNSSISPGVIRREQLVSRVLLGFPGLGPFVFLGVGYLDDTCIYGKINASFCRL